MAPPNRQSMPYRPCVGMMVINADGRVLVHALVDDAGRACRAHGGGKAALAMKLLRGAGAPMQESAS